jgi:ketosteroid isomerase-like protein
MTGKSVVARYFEALDAADAGVIPELFSRDCQIFRPELPEPLVGAEAVKVVVTMAQRIFENFETTVLDAFEDGDAVVVRVRHDAVYRNEWRTRIGTFDVAGKGTSWEAVALFRLRDGKIVEERVFRDELGMLLDIGALDPARTLRSRDSSLEA